MTVYGSVPLVTIFNGTPPIPVGPATEGSLVRVTLLPLVHPILLASLGFAVNKSKGKNLWARKFFEPYTGKS